MSTTQPAAQHKKFKTEVQQLLDLVIHSLYSNREIFLRELISNASDAIDRARFESLSDQAVLENDPEWDILITSDPKAKTLTIADNGIGMTAKEVEANIGTIASSGTKKFLAELKGRDGVVPPELIGQFGVGFYSSFMVADKVEVVTRRAGDKAAGTRWESTGNGEYTLETVEKEKRGTTITLHIKEDAAEFLDEWKIRKIVKKYSDFVEHPVRLQAFEEKDGKREEKAPELLNSRKAIWQRAKSEIKDEEYKEFYKLVAHDFQEPAETLHWTGEGATEFKALLYLPKSAGMAFMMPEDTKHGIHLYVKRVFITDNCEEVRPQYLRFLRGVVDSADLPLNISREMLQENKLLRVIRNNLTKKVLDTLADMKEKRRDAYNEFWREFGHVLKEGVHVDPANLEKIEELILCETANGKPGSLTSLAEYVKLMPDSQKEIYFATGEGRQTLENSPHFEAFRKAGYDVLFFTDPIDEWIVNDLTKYKDKPFKNVTRGNLDLPEVKTDEKAKEELKPLLGFIKETLGDRIQDVKESNRLTDSACCLVFDEHAMGPAMERIYKAMNRDMPKAKGELEINPSHPLIRKMEEIHQADPKHAKLAEYAELLYDQALLTAGQPVADLLQFTRRVSQLMATEAETLARK